MSQLVISGADGESFALNVVDFNTYMLAQENSCQCKMLQVHFPIRMAQPNVAFDVSFLSDADYQLFQGFVRRQQLLAVVNTQVVNFFWPERNINNWSGVISKIEAGDMRWNFAPHTRIEVELVHSLISTKSSFGSISAYWTSVYGIDMPNGVLNEPSMTATQQMEMNGITFNSSGTEVTNSQGITLQIPTGQIVNSVLKGS